MKLFCVALSTSTTSLSCPGALIPFSIFMLKDFNNTINRYNAVAHM